MNSSRIPILIFVLLLIIGVLQAGYYFPKLPDQMATHFDAAGKANGFMHKLTHTIFMASLQIGLFGMFLGFVFFMKRIPDSLINMPHKDYWLAPQRRDESLSKMIRILLFIGIVTQILLLAVNQMVVDFNLGGKGMDYFWFVFIGYMVVIFGTVAWIYYVFRIPKEDVSLE